MKKGTPFVDVTHVQLIVGRANYVAGYFGGMKAQLLRCGKDPITQEYFCIILVTYQDVYKIEFNFDYNSPQATMDNLDNLVLMACRKIFEHAAEKATKTNRFNFKPARNVTQNN